jgi:hypothetical protein
MSRPQDREEIWQQIEGLVDQLRRKALVSAGNSADPLWDVHTAVLDLQGKVDEAKRHDLQLDWVRG